jgi:HK97 family phage prohead protease
MEADFSGYATKVGLKCSDGRTIMKDAFKHLDKQRVPLVWQHQHNEPGNILGYAELENRSDGVYAYGFFNETDAGKNAKQLVKHKDINALSIYANGLRQQGGNVLHGDIKEVSLVLSGANPGAFIDNVNLVHSDGNFEVVEDEDVIYTGLEFDNESDAEHADNNQGDTVATTANTDSSSGDKTVQEVFDELTDEQKNVVYFMIGEAINAAQGDGSIAQSDIDELDDDILEHAAAAAALTDDSTVEDVFNSLTEQQQSVVYFMVGEALENGAGPDAQHSQTDGDSAEDTIQHSQEDNMGRNVFDQSATFAQQGPTLTHAQLDTIVKDAQKIGSFKEAFLEHAAEYGIEDIDILFPDAKAVANSPEIVGRRTEWVNDIINGTKHSPFSRIKSTAVDLTADEARAKGYVKGNLKKDEIIKLLKRVTVPTTIYKKQKLDRDDIVDITDLDVVAWLKAEMRLMLDEELARAVLIGDGRDADDEDKIDADHIRPIAYDADMYAHGVTIGGDLTPEAIVEGILRARSFYRGTGTPVLYTTDAVLTDLILSKDRVGRRLYESEAALAAALRVSKIVTVEVMEDTPDIIGIVVNLSDYTLGADRGGNVSMFDDFDIDYNQYKYLIETRVSGALTKPKSALVIRRVVGTLVTPTSPSYNGTTHVITLPTIAGVIYSVEGTDRTGDVTIEETSEVEARPAAGYSFPTNTNRTWTFAYTA